MELAPDTVDYAIEPDAIQQADVIALCVKSGATADVARRLLRGLGHSAGLIEAAWKRTAVAAVNGGVPLEEVAQWVDMPVEMLREMLTADRQETAAESDASKGGSAVS